MLDGYKSKSYLNILLSAGVCYHDLTEAIFIHFLLGMLSLHFLLLPGKKIDFDFGI